MACSGGHSIANTWSRNITRVTPIEADTGEELALVGETFTVELAPQEVASFEVTLG